MFLEVVRSIAAVNHDLEFRPLSTSTNQYDVIIVGTGAGGGSLAYALAGWGKKILLLERGDYLPRERENWMPEEVFARARYKDKAEKWLDRRNRSFVPGMHYYVGGNTKMYGAALPRLRREDFAKLQLLDGDSPEWPISYEDLEPYYSRAEELYKVHGLAGEDPTDPPRSTPFPKPPIEHEPQIEKLAASLRRQGLHPFHLPLGVDFDRSDLLAGKCVLWKACDGFPCLLGAKSDAETCAIEPALKDPNITLIRNAKVEKLVPRAGGKEIDYVEARINEKDVVQFRGHLVVVSCGAVNSAALLLRSGVANSSGLVGCNYMAHLNATVMAWNPREQKTVFQKTLALNDFYLAGPNNPYPLGNAQLIGKVDRHMMRAGLPWWLSWMRNRVFSPVLDHVCAHSLDWWVLGEDAPLKKNRVEVVRDGKIRVSVRWTNRSAQRQLVRRLRSVLRRAGYPICFWRIWNAEKIESCSHQVGTLRFGHDPDESVLDVFCRSHDVKNLFVVDGSFFPSSGAVNPALTIIAQALRVGDYIKSNFGQLCFASGSSA